MFTALEKRGGKEFQALTQTSPEKHYKQTSNQRQLIAFSNLVSLTKGKLGTQIMHFPNYLLSFLLTLLSFFFLPPFPPPSPLLPCCCSRFACVCLSVCLCLPLSVSISISLCLSVCVSHPVCTHVPTYVNAPVCVCTYVLQCACRHERTTSALPPHLPHCRKWGLCVLCHCVH